MSSANSASSSLDIIGNSSAWGYIRIVFWIGDAPFSWFSSISSIRFSLSALEFSVHARYGNSKI